MPLPQPCLANKMMRDECHLWLGDNLTLMRERIEDNSIDLIYIDPPFRSGRNYSMKRAEKGNSIKQAFSDNWKWDKETEAAISKIQALDNNGMASYFQGMLTILGRSSSLAYLLFMAPRLLEMRRILKLSGSLYYHCDQSASHHIRMLLDAVFGEDDFLNQVVWCYGLGGSSRHRWPRKHDDIFWYAKSTARHFFNPSLEPARSQRLKGKLKKSPDYWYFPSINNMARERTGYPTQKPLALMDRIVSSSCPQGGIVLDPFCGSGTTLEAADRNGLRWIGIDASPEAIAIADKRVNMIER
jgi:DNA modification methylase